MFYICYQQPSCRARFPRRFGTHVLQRLEKSDTLPAWERVVWQRGKASSVLMTCMKLG